MTKKDYIKLARAIKDNTDNQAEDMTNHFVIYRDQFIDDLCDILKADNPRFDADKFIKACNS